MDTGRRLVAAQVAWGRPNNGCATLRPLVEAAGQRVPIGLVQADAACDSERNHQDIRHHIGAASLIPAKRGKADRHMSGIRAQMRQQLPSEPSRQCALAESLSSSVKRKLSTQAPGRSIHMQPTQALWLGLAYDIYRL